jgi:hypothetical protein
VDSCAKRSLISVKTTRQSEALASLARRRFAPLNSPLHLLQFSRLQQRNLLGKYVFQADPASFSVGTPTLAAAREAHLRIRHQMVSPKRD